MHDFDRITAEYESLIPEIGESEHYGEWEAEAEAESERYWGEMPLSEGEEMEQAAALLDVRNEQELDHFLGNLISKVGKGISGFANSSVGKALGGALKKVAKAALPVAGTALGSLVGGPAGGMLGGKLASAAWNMFGLELEGLSGEDREFETARRFVRFAHSAAKHAARSPRRGNPQQAARAAVMKAAQQHAPGLLSTQGGRHHGVPRAGGGFYGDTSANGDGSGPDGAYDDGATADDQGSDGAGGDGYDSGDPGGTGPSGAQRRGTWIRRGRRIIIFGV
jgi:hypothetical protein